MLRFSDQRGGQQNIAWLEQLSRDQGRVVKALKDKPDLYQHLRPMWDAFHILGSSRSCGFGIGPIPLSEIFIYMNWYPVIGKDEQMRWISLIRSMDSAYLGEVNKEKEK